MNIVIHKYATTFKGPATSVDNKTAPELNDTCQKEDRMPSDTKSESSLLDGNSHTTAWPGGRPYAKPLYHVLTLSTPYRNFQSYSQVFRCLLLWTVCGYRSGRWSRDGYKLRLRRSLRNFWLTMNSIRHNGVSGRRMADFVCPYCKSQITNDLVGSIVPFVN